MINRNHLLYSLKNLRVNIFQNAINLILSYGITAIFGFIFWIIAARIYSEINIGLSSAIISIIGLIALFSEFGFGISVIRYLPENKYNSEELINTCLSMSGVIALTISFIYILYSNYISLEKLINSDILLILLFVIICIFSSETNILINIFLTKNYTQPIVFINLTIGIFKLILVYSLYNIFNNFIGIIIAFGISSILFFIISINFYFTKLFPNYKYKFVFNYNLMKQLILYSFCNYLAKILMQITPLILPILVLWILGPKSTAYFFIAWSLVSMLQVIPASLFNSLFADCCNQKINLLNNIRNYFLILFLIFIPIIIIAYFYANNLLLLYGESYALYSSNLLIILIIATIPWSINYLLITIERIKKENNIAQFLIVIISLSSCLFSLFLSYIFVILYGLIGIGIGYLLGQTLTSIIFIIKFRHNYYKSSPPENL